MSCHHKTASQMLAEESRPGILLEVDHRLTPSKRRPLATAGKASAARLVSKMDHSIQLSKARRCIKTHHPRLVLDSYSVSVA